MDMWDRFDLKISLNFTGYADRSKLMDKELERVGIKEVYKIWQFPCPFDRTIQSFVPRNRMMGHPGFFNSVIGHYRAIKTAYCLGVEHCLIMEDDIRFLKDLHGIEEILGDMPRDYDIALLDVLRPMKMPMQEFKDRIKRDKVGKYWVKFINARSAGCYSMSRRGMERWIKGMEDPALGRGGKMRLADQYFNLAHIGLDLKAYHAIPTAARQVLIGSGHSNSGYSELDSWYGAIGCDTKAYAD